MKTQIAFYYLLFLLPNIPLAAMTLSITSTPDSGNIFIDGKRWEGRDTTSLFAAFGKPDRTEIHRYMSPQKEFGYDGMPPSYWEKEVSIPYFVYDSLGIMFATKSASYEQHLIHKMFVFFDNTRTFDHSVQPPFKPTHFSKSITLNGNTINGSTPIIPSGVTYKTSEFPFVGITVGPTSILTFIDSLFSIKSHLYFRFFLDNKEQQHLSYLEITIS